MKSEEKIREGATPFLEEGESVLAAFVARPRGWTQQNAGVRAVGGSQMAKAAAGAEACTACAPVASATCLAAAESLR